MDLIKQCKIERIVREIVRDNKEKDLTTLKRMAKRKVIEELEDYEGASKLNTDYIWEIFKEELEKEKTKQEQREQQTIKKEKKAKSEGER